MNWQEYYFYHQNQYSSTTEDAKRAYYENTQSQANKAKENELKIIVTPEYTPPERRFPKFKTANLEDLKISLVTEYSKSPYNKVKIYMSISLHNDLTEYDSILLHVEGIGYKEIPLDIHLRINRGNILIKEYEVGKIRVRQRQIRKEFWSLERLLWECLKESQYVEFEEITG